MFGRGAKKRKPEKAKKRKPEKAKNDGGGFRYRLTSVSADAAELDILQQYKIGDATVYVTTDGRYIVNEPKITDEAKKLYNLIIRRIDLGIRFDADAKSDEKILASRLEESFWKIAERENRLEEAQRLFPNLQYYVRRNVIGYDILDVMMEDPDIEDILCSAPRRNIRVVSRRHSGRFHTLESNVMFEDQTDMERFIQRVYGKTATEPTESQPMSVTHMPDGSRISATFGTQISKPDPSSPYASSPRVR